jgi:hypothetical protein
VVIFVVSEIILNSQNYKGKSLYLYIIT